jgi:hypothetical protein
MQKSKFFWNADLQRVATKNLTHAWFELHGWPPAEADDDGDQVVPSPVHALN